MKKIVVVVILCVTFVSACRVGKDAYKNLSYLYDKDFNVFVPEFVAYHQNDSLTTVYYKIESGSLLYVKDLEKGIFTAGFSIKAELYESYDMKQLLDSARIVKWDEDNSDSRMITGHIDINAHIQGAYVLRLICTDIQKRSVVESYVEINRKSPFGEQNFISMSVDSAPRFNHWVATNESFFLQANNTRLDTLWVRYFNKDYPIASPPFSMSNDKPFDFKADSIFAVPIKNGLTANIVLPKKGLYLFQSDTTTKEGYAFLRFDESFPEITTVNQMLYPLRYLTAKDEYNEMVLIKNKKEAIDKFWLEVAGNPSRAKELIKLYYNRVEDANRYFTSYLEGWKTDRGLIYIVYGAPHIVYRGNGVENWVYGEEKNMLSTTFTFYKVENPFSDNDYNLYRSPAFKDIWYIAVDSWRR